MAYQFFRSTALGFALGAAAASAMAQAYEQRSGDYTLRSSVVASTAISATASRQHGIEPSPTRALVTVSLQKSLHDDQGKAWNPVPAEVTVEFRGEAREWAVLPVTEVRANGGVSYVGVFDHAAPEELEFVINGRPQGGGASIVLRFNKRMPAPLVR